MGQGRGQDGMAFAVSCLLFSLVASWSPLLPLPASFASPEGERGAKEGGEMPQGSAACKGGVERVEIRKKIMNV